MVWLCKTKIGWKFKTLLYGYKQLQYSWGNIWLNIKDIGAVETGFGTSNFEFDRPLPKGKIKKVIELMKVELGGQIMKEFASPYSKDNNDEKQ